MLVSENVVAVCVSLEGLSVSGCGRGCGSVGCCGVSDDGRFRGVQSRVDIVELGAM